MAWGLPISFLPFRIGALKSLKGRITKGNPKCSITGEQAHVAWHLVIDDTVPTLISQFHVSRRTVFRIKMAEILKKVSNPSFLLAKKYLCSSPFFSDTWSMFYERSIMRGGHRLPCT